MAVDWWRKRELERERRKKARRAEYEKRERERQKERTIARASQREKVMDALANHITRTFILVDRYEQSLVDRVVVALRRRQQRSLKKLRGR